MLSLLLAMSACELVEPNFLASDPPDPACEVEDADVTGTWIIEGAGERFDCDDDMYDTSRFTLRSTEPLRIGQTEGTLDLEDPPSGFALSGGTVMGRCVAFRTIEDTDVGRIDLMWEGVVSETGNTLTGQFNGTGPSNCETRGDFRIDLR